MRLTGAKNMIGIRRRQMRKESKWVYAVLFMAVLLLAAGNSSTVYAKSNTSKTVSISAKELSLTKGQSAALSVKNNGKKVKWVSSNKKVAAVNGKGKIKALKKGTAVVTAAVGKKKYKCSVTVSDKKANVLIVYFSTTGTTKSAAKKIQKETNGTLIRLQPQKAYTKNYSKLLNVAMDEQESDLRPALATTIKNIKQYDTILLGFPIWHGKEPMLVRTFLEKHNVSGKTILPFCTSGGSGISGSMSGIRKYAKGAGVMQGKDLSGLSQAGIREWLKKAGVI
jgi:flavodoxin